MGMIGRCGGFFDEFSIFFFFFLVLFGGNGGLYILYSICHSNISLHPLLGTGVSLLLGFIVKISVSVHGGEFLKTEPRLSLCT